jgi:DNA-binding transcriptional regulator/RsmH inhibitor MraZ
LADYAGLGKEVVLIGIDDHFELWDAARWQRYSQHKDSSPKP